VQETERVAPRPMLNGVVPPVPVQDPVYVVDCDGETDVEPEVPTDPIPEMVQLVALVDDHDNVDEFPCAIVDGESESVAVGGVGTVTTTELYVVHDV